MAMQLKSLTKKMRRRTGQPVDFMQLTPAEMFHFDRIDGGKTSFFDSAGVLVAAGHIEAGLVVALSDHLIDLTDDERTALFDTASNGPLATLGSKITMAHALGVIGRMLKEDLQAVQAVRNFFAHHASHTDFTDLELVELVEAMNFTRYSEIANAPALAVFIVSPRDRFMDNCKWMFMALALGPPRASKKTVNDREIYPLFPWPVEAPEAWIEPLTAT